MLQAIEEATHRISDFYLFAATCYAQLDDPVAFRPGRSDIKFKVGLVNEKAASWTPDHR